MKNTQTHWPQWPATAPTAVPNQAITTHNTCQHHNLSHVCCVCCVCYCRNSVWWSQRLDCFHYFRCTDCGRQTERCFQSIATRWVIILLCFWLCALRWWRLSVIAGKKIGKYTQPTYSVSKQTHTTPNSHSFTCSHNHSHTLTLTHRSEKRVDRRATRGSEPGCEGKSGPRQRSEQGGLGTDQDRHWVSVVCVCVFGTCVVGCLGVICDLYVSVLDVPYRALCVLCWMGCNRSLFASHQLCMFCVSVSDAADVSQCCAEVHSKVRSRSSECLKIWFSGRITSTARRLSLLSTHVSLRGTCVVVGNVIVM